jgi:hypothetical protein
MDVSFKPYTLLLSRIREMENLVTPCIDTAGRIMRLAILAPTTRHAASLHFQQSKAGEERGIKKSVILFAFRSLIRNFAA